ncbi:glycosyltransferase family 4 protein [Spongiibacter marinus]|uniref:glycosyltransferase family 4 protein n=1 Tax=Spongiibacter marinus TaxID=354246 RepID=UPI0004044651|nr:glycosyltransferase family 4 protein [Spongiibacter marinus]
MRIIFFHLYNDRSGSPKVLSGVVDACELAGIEFQVVTSRHKDGFLNKFSSNSKYVFYKRSENKFVTLVYYFLSQIHLFFICLLRCRDADVYYVNTMMPFAAGLAGVLLRKKIIFHVHETSLRPLLFKRFLRGVIEVCADRVLYVSDYLRKAEPFSRPASSIVYNAVSSPDIDYLADCSSALERPFRVLMVCSFKDYKGVAEYISLARSCSDRSIFLFELVLNASELEVSREVGGVLPSNLQIYSRQSDLSSFYRRASVVMNLSRPDEWIETFGLTLLEAMSYGVPVIAPPVGGPAEIVVDGESGYLVSCYDTDTLKDRLIYLADDQNFYTAMSRKAYERSKDFDINIFRENILKNINECVGVL